MFLSTPTVLSVLALLATPIVAANATQASDAGIYVESSSYEYYGCYNETVDIAGSSGARALDDGTSFVQKGNMTVLKCLEFCTSNGTDYQFAGLEYSRQGSSLQPMRKPRNLEVTDMPPYPGNAGAHGACPPSQRS
ncbi:hypothetical protein AK830_g10950 [Neonectria ditissima]|uniref:WSC domain-containing protein n=1 Tax=Neonectria ditissima TaxID=78410 RepID=A0A0P7B506_9HYPO|nr:hypothetical protein AK830_g10950 [Neonectria ditissima]